jgi:hypothetical protein
VIGRSACRPPPCRTRPLWFITVREAPPWHPWRVLRDHHDDVTVSCLHRLPDRIMGLQLDRRIWLARGLTQAERRCTLTHELVHRERGPVPTDPLGAAREERVVDEIASRRLITLGALVDGLRWTRHSRELAELLWVDEPTLHARMNAFDPTERAELAYHFGDDWLWIP